MRPDCPALRANNSLFPIKQVRSLDLLDGSTESTPEIPHKSRRTLMSPQEYEIPRDSPNQLKIKPYFPALAPEQYPIPHHTTSGLTSFRQLPKFPETHVFSLKEHQFQHRNSRKSLFNPYHLKKKADSKDSIEQVGQLSTSTSRGAFTEQ